MPEYIERDECRNEFYESVLCILSEDSTNDRANQIIDAFDDLPTADVQPVVHAHWIPQYVSKRGLSDFFTCSECDKSCFTYHKVKMCSNNFCPNCGARMDGDDNAKEN